MAQVYVIGRVTADLELKGPVNPFSQIPIE